MRWDDVSYLFNGVVRNLELITIGIDELAIVRIWDMLNCRRFGHVLSCHGGMSVLLEARSGAEGLDSSVKERIIMERSICSEDHSYR